jgi:hypothetical protein
LKLGPGAGAALEDRNLTFLDTLVYFVICCMSNNSWKVVRSSAENIAQAARCWSGDIQQSLNNLEDRGYISVLRNHWENNMYRINEHPANNSEVSKNG